MTTVPTDLPFWGQRPYLQSSQLVDAFEQALPDFGVTECLAISVKFRSFLRSQGEFHLSDGTTGKGTDLGSFTLESPGGKVAIGLRATDLPVSPRIPDDEKLLIAKATINAEDNSGRVAEYPASRFFATLVALNKKLIVDTQGIESGKAWILAKLDLRTPFLFTREEPPLECRIASVIADRMINTHLVIHNETVGSTVFTKVDKP